MIFVRHAQAKTGADDAMRMLTLEGRRQVIELMEKLGGRRFNYIITSPAVRAKQTAGLIVGEDESPKIFEIESMYASLDPSDQRALIEMLGALG
ncbi:MAG: histidine phosphatase family protein, partial [Candidatus Pacebacteria bacterium]|nr:histidine phosphatase family protein [Candidatus Paceibacterota bacterium]